jgi:hypothetical protein
MVRTQHTWTASRFSRTGNLDAITIAVREKLDEFYSAGKIDTNIGEITEDPVNDQFTAVRTFVDRAAAEEWVTFLSQYSPDSATILEG